MRYGYGTYLPSGPATPRELREEIIQVESAGLDAIFFSEHHGVNGYAPDPLALAVFALGQTTTLRAGPMPLLLPLRQPVHVAETAAMADFVSDGRLILGIAAGYLAQDFQQVGLQPADRGQRMEEACTLLHAVWKGAPVEFSGRFFSATLTRPLLHQAGRGSPPVWIASSTMAGIRRAARWGEGIMFDSLLDGQHVAELSAAYRQACRERGREPGVVGVIRRCWFGAGAEVDDYLRRFIAQLEASPSFATHADKAWVRDRHSRSWVQDVVFAGQPAELAESLDAWSARAGVDYVMLKLHWGAREFDQLQAQLRLAAHFMERARST